MIDSDDDESLPSEPDPLAAPGSDVDDLDGMPTEAEMEILGDDRTRQKGIEEFAEDSFA